MVIHIGQRSVGEHAETYNETECSEIEEVTVVVETGQGGKSDSVLRKTDNVNRSGNQVMNIIRIGRHAYRLLSYVLLFSSE